MNLKRVLLLMIFIGVVSTSCKKDDDPVAEVVPPRLLSDVEAENDADIIAFLKSNTYNYLEFQNEPEGFDYKIKFSPSDAGNPDLQPIFDRPELVTETITVKSSDFNKDDGEEVAHTLYILIARQGVKMDSMPTIGDNTLLQYEGSLLDGTFFDASSNQPVIFNLSGVVRGFGNGVEHFKKGIGPIENDDGTVSYEEYGIGAIFIPSGLGYFSVPQNSIIEAYTPLIFKVDTFDYEPNTDSDGDGIPNIKEDVNLNGNLNDDNTDGDLAVDYLDSDDDNDGTPTLEEISDDEGNIIIPYPDSDGDGTPDYLDDNFS